MARLAWFSPMPPATTGVATCSAELVEGLAADHEIHVFVHDPWPPAGPAVPRAAGVYSAYDFVWQHQQRPYDLTVYQLGNSSHHDYQWPYLFRYPGLVVLHDAHLHHARAACLLRNARAHDYRTEFAWNHPDANPDLAELAVKGFDSHLHYLWPMTRLAARAARLVAVHSWAIAERLQQETPDLRVEVIHLGHGRLVPSEEGHELGRRMRDRYGIAPDALVFGCYGGLTPEKRLPQVLAAFAVSRAFLPSAHLLLAGAVPSHYDLPRDIERQGLQDCTTLTGYLQTDEDLTASIAACDVALNLRWPTAREVSGPWLRCLAAGKPTVIVDLAHLVGVPTVDPRTWQPNTRSSDSASEKSPCAVAIDIVDEDHSLRLAMRRLGTDPALREALGTGAREYWSNNHSIEIMLDDYRRLIAEALTCPVRPAPLPAHLLDTGDGTLETVVGRFGLPSPFGTGESPEEHPVSLR